MEITGKIIEVLPLKNGTSSKGEWQSQQYVLETIEQYPHKFLFEVFGADKISSFAIQIGEQVTISYKDSWYGSNHAWKVVRSSSAAPTSPSTQENSETTPY